MEIMQTSQQQLTPVTAKPQLSFAESIEVWLGPTQQRFSVHRDVITRRSSFFNSACKTTWQTDGPKPIALSKEDPFIFDLYLKCLYSNEVNVDVRGKLEDEEDGLLRGGTILRRMTKAYILADKLGDIRSCNLLIDKFIQASTSYPANITGRTVRIAYDGTPKSSPLRRVLVHHFAYVVETPQTADWQEEVPPEFALDLILELHAFVKDKHCHMQPSKRSKCGYHHHDESHWFCDAMDCKGGDDLGFWSDFGYDTYVSEGSSTIEEVR